MIGLYLKNYINVVSITRNIMALRCAAITMQDYLDFMIILGFVSKSFDTTFLLDNQFILFKICYKF